MNNIYEMADEIAKENMGSITKWCMENNMPYVLGVMEGAGYYSNKPMLLLHTNDISKNTKFIRFTLCCQQNSTKGSLSISYAPIKPQGRMISIGETEL